MGDEFRIIQGIDIVDLIGFIKRKNKVYQRILLENLELVLDPSSKEFARTRKLYLDTINDYTRSILQLIFGEDFEGKIT